MMGIIQITICEWWNKYWHDQFDQNANWHRQLQTCLTETIPCCHKNTMMDEINKLLEAMVIHSSHSGWSAPITIIPKGDGGKHLVINYKALNEVTQKFIWPMPKVKDIFHKLNGVKYFSTLNLQAGYHHIPLDDASIPKQPSCHLLENMSTRKFPLD